MCIHVLCMDVCDNMCADIMWGSGLQERPTEETRLTTDFRRKHIDLTH